MIAADLFHTIADYHLHNQLEALQKDGEQTYSIGYCAAQRLSILARQLQLVDPRFNTFLYSHLDSMVWAVGIWGAYGDKIVERYCDSDILSELIRKITNLIKKLMPYAGFLLNSTCCISYASFLYRGFYFKGGLGLGTIALMKLKSNQLLPAEVESCFDKLEQIAFLVVCMTTSMWLPLRIIAIAVNIVTLVARLLTAKCLIKHFSSYLEHPFKGVHHYQTITPENFVWFSRARLSFKVNPSYIYAEEVGHIFPLDAEPQQEGVSVVSIFEELKTRIQDKKVRLTEQQVTGLENIKTAAITGRVRDVTPGDIPTFQKVIRTLIRSLLQDEQNFIEKVEELAEIGNSCTEGWTREVIWMLEPRTQNIRWAVHHVLAKMRGEVVKEKFYQNPVFRGIVDCGMNNIHVTNAIQVAFRHRFRTYEGELYTNLHPWGILQSLCCRYWLPENRERNMGYVEAFYISLILATVHQGLALGGSEWVNFFDDLRQQLFGLSSSPMEDNPADLLVDYIYDAIRVHYIEMEDHTLEIRRQIAWEAVINWMKENPSVFLAAHGEGYHPDYIAQDLLGNHHLTKKGVQLLLWDMGILTAKAAR